MQEPRAVFSLQVYCLCMYMNYVPERRGQGNPESTEMETTSFFEEGQWRGH